MRENGLSSPATNYFCPSYAWMRHWALRLQSRDRLEFFFVFINETFSLLFRIKNFCGSIADAVQSKTNKIHIRYFADALAINSSFNILYTAYREKGNKGRPGHTSRGFMGSLEINLLPFSLTFLSAPFCAFHRQWIKTYTIAQPNVGRTSTIARIRRALNTRWGATDTIIAGFAGTRTWRSVKWVLSSPEVVNTTFNCISFSSLFRVGCQPSKVRACWYHSYSIWCHVGHHGDSIYRQLHEEDHARS